MAFSDRLAFARKQKKIKQSDLGKTIGTSRDIIRKYERGENVPSTDVATKIANALGVTLDYLVKDGEYEQIDNDTLKKLKAIQELDSDTKAHIFATIDAFIKAAKLKNIAAL
ncbi:MAG: helix-turn-helix transcriptional regulator [Chryseobacterium sp.]|uniref:helix-turn-helix domain-containing protein n=1 Tax=Chryseobacterium sp. TaxID=1871047 RepID=UPI0025C03DEC|nr:helix-turn-helix transcriptional regulator [Chryseobacterium sp.]MCJ7932446.1 helix-turn-helix transcriptional regulator [Chryseobacterium sp.]